MGVCLPGRLPPRPFNFGPTITPELANYCGTGGAVCGDSNGRSIASDVYYGQKYTSGAYGQGPPGIFRGTTTRPGTFPPNRFGLHDMHGNVWEYCLDKVTATYADVPRDGLPTLQGRGTRSGCCAVGPGRTTRRSAALPTGIECTRTAGWEGRIGLRVVCTI